MRCGITVFATFLIILDIILSVLADYGISLTTLLVLTPSVMAILESTMGLYDIWLSSEVNRVSFKFDGNNRRKI